MGINSDVYHEKKRLYYFPFKEIRTLSIIVSLHERIVKSGYGQKQNVEVTLIDEESKKKVHLAQIEAQVLSPSNAVLRINGSEVVKRKVYFGTYTFIWYVDALEPGEYTVDFTTHKKGYRDVTTTKKFRIEPAA